MSSRPLIATVIGDPSGIGPEVCVKALETGEPQALSRVLLVGNAAALRRAAEVCGSALRFAAVPDVGAAKYDSEAIQVLDTGDLKPSDYKIGAVSAACGKAAFDWIVKALDLAERGVFDGVILGPINSQAFKLAGVAQRPDSFAPPNTYQFRINGPLRVVPISEHLRIRDVAAAVKKARVLEVITLVDAALRKWGVASPRIGVAGLNPHAMFEEDKAEIEPAVQAAKAAGLQVVGPISPDAVFRQALEGQHDAVVSMYHDQGQIAVKTAAFAGACTVFLGLPYVRVGIPHGTGHDIAGTGKAQHFTMLAAMKTVAALAGGKGFLSMPREPAPVQ